MKEGDFLDKFRHPKCGGTKEERMEVKDMNVHRFLMRISSLVRHSYTRNIFVLTILDRTDDSPQRRLARSWFNRGLLNKDGKYTFITRSGSTKLKVIDIRTLTDVPDTLLESFVNHVKGDGTLDIHYNGSFMERLLRLVAEKIKIGRYPVSVFCV